MDGDHKSEKFTQSIVYFGKHGELFGFWALGRKAEMSLRTRSVPSWELTDVVAKTPVKANKSSTQI